MRFSARPPKPILPNTGNINHFVDGGSQNFTVVSIMLRCTCQELELNTVTRQVETYESLREKWSAELSKLRTEHAQKQHLISDLEHSLEECSKQPQNQQVQTSVYILLLIFGRHANKKGQIQRPGRGLQILLPKRLKIWRVKMAKKNVS